MQKHHSLGFVCGTAALIGAAGTSYAAEPFSLNFDGPGTTAEAFAPVFLTIGYGQYVPALDGFGDPIPGSEHWEIDPLGGDVPVVDPSTVGWGLAPSGTKALDARDGPVLLVFDTAFSFDSFSVTLDNSTLGDLSPTETAIKFFDADNALLFSAPANQAIPGLVINVGSIGPVKTILLPPTATYDNVVAVPEPTAAVALLGGSGLLLGLRRRRA